MIAPRSVLIHKYLKKVIDSTTFSRSSVNKELFKYLVSQSLKGETPKEYQIVHDVFGKQKADEKDSNVRVYIHNLRKKIDEYYFKEGGQDEIKFQLPKGGYKVDFKLNKRSYIKRKIVRFSPFVFLLGMMLTFVALFLFTKKNRPEPAKHFIWNSIYTSEYPTLIVLGDHYFFQGKTAMGGSTIMRNVGINSDADFDKWAANHPDTKHLVRKSKQTYINKQAPFGLFKIMELIGGGNTKLDFKYASELQWNDVKEKNIIFVGSFKTQHILKEIHEKIGVAYAIKEATLFFKGKDTVASYHCTDEDFLNLDYPTITFFKTKDGRTITSFMSSKDLGNYALLKYLGVPENLKMLEDQLANFSTTNLRAVFEVKGRDKTDFNVNLINMVPIKEKVNEIWPH